jgi:hypothetical protein
VTVDDAVVSAGRRAVVHVVAFQAAPVAAHPAAVDHVVAVEVAAIAVSAPLVAVGAVLALAPRPSRTAPVAGMAPHRAQQRRKDEPE